MITEAEYPPCDVLYSGVRHNGSVSSLTELEQRTRVAARAPIRPPLFSPAPRAAFYDVLLVLRCPRKMDETII